MGERRSTSVKANINVEDDSEYCISFFCHLNRFLRHSNPTVTTPVWNRGTKSSGRQGPRGHVLVLLGISTFIIFSTRNAHEADILYGSDSAPWKADLCFFLRYPRHLLLCLTIHQSSAVSPGWMHSYRFKFGSRFRSTSCSVLSQVISPESSVVSRQASIRYLYNMISNVARVCAIFQFVSSMVLNLQVLWTNLLKEHPKCYILRGSCPLYPCVSGGVGTLPHPHYYITTANYLQLTQCLCLPYQDVQWGLIELCFSGSGSCNCLAPCIMLMPPLSTHHVPRR